MSETNGTMKEIDIAAVRDEWIAAVNELVTRVEGWCKEMDWVTRKAPKKFKDKRIGAYDAPMLLLQHWDNKLLLEPISRFVAGEDVTGRIDLYTMPEYDDVAVLIRQNNDWKMRVQCGKEESDFVPFTRDSFKDVIETFARRHAETQ